MSDIWGIVLGILFLVVWIVVVSYTSSAHNAYTQGRIDQIRHKNKYLNYKGIPSLFYKHGRKVQARQYKAKVRARLLRNNDGNPRPN